MTVSEATARPIITRDTTPPARAAALAQRYREAAARYRMQLHQQGDRRVVRYFNQQLAAVRWWQGEAVRLGWRLP